MQVKIAFFMFSSLSQKPAKTPYVLNSFCDSADVNFTAE